MDPAWVLDVLNNGTHTKKAMRQLVRYNTIWPVHLGCPSGLSKESMRCPEIDILTKMRRWQPAVKSCTWCHPVEASRHPVCGGILWRHPAENWPRHGGMRKFRRCETLTKRQIDQARSPKMKKRLEQSPGVHNRSGRLTASSGRRITCRNCGCFAAVGGSCIPNHPGNDQVVGQRNGWWCHGGTKRFRRPNGHQGGWADSAGQAQGTQAANSGTKVGSGRQIVPPEASQPFGGISRIEKIFILQVIFSHFTRRSARGDG